MEKKKEIEKIKEVFDIEKNGKIKEVIKKGELPLEHSQKEQKNYQNKILNWTLIGIVILLILFIFTVFLVNSLKIIKYEGFKFEKEKAGNVIFYKMSFPLFNENKNQTYQLFIRTNPKEFDKVPLDGEMHVKQIVVLNSTNELNCEGDGVIALANIYQLFPYIGLKLINDPNATCDSQDRYMFVNIVNSTQTSIEQTGKSCYQINVNNCEILKATEKFMIEVLIKRRELIETARID